MVPVRASRLSKFLEAFSQFSEEVLVEPEDEWLAIRAIDRLRITAAFGKLKLEEPLYDKFGLNLRLALRFLKHIRGEVILSLDRGKLIIEGNGFSLKIDTIDPKALKPIPEPALSFDLSADIEIDLLSEALKNLRKVDEITFIADRTNGLRAEAKTETSQYSCWLGTPTFKTEVPEVRAKFTTQFLRPIVNALSVLSRPPNATFTTVELKTNHPAKFTLKDDDLHFTAYIAPRLD